MLNSDNFSIVSEENIYFRRETTKESEQKHGYLTLNSWNEAIKITTIVYQLCQSTLSMKGLLKLHVHSL